MYSACLGIYGYISFRDCYHYLFIVLCSAAFHLFVVCAFITFLNKYLVSFNLNALSLTVPEISTGNQITSLVT